MSNNIANYKTGDVVAYSNNVNQNGVFIISKTSNEKFSALYISGGYNYNKTYTFSGGSWTVA